MPLEACIPTQDATRFWPGTHSNWLPGTALGAILNEQNLSAFQNTFMHTSRNSRLKAVSTFSFHCFLAPDSSALIPVHSLFGSYAATLLSRLVPYSVAIIFSAGGLCPAR